MKKNTNGKKIIRISGSWNAQLANYYDNTRTVLIGKIGTQSYHIQKRWVLILEEIKKPFGAFLLNLIEDSK